MDGINIFKNVHFISPRYNFISIACDFESLATFLHANDCYICESNLICWCEYFRHFEALKIAQHYDICTCESKFKHETITTCWGLALYRKYDFLMLLHSPELKSMKIIVIHFAIFDILALKCLPQYSKL